MRGLDNLGMKVEERDFKKKMSAYGFGQFFSR